MKNLIIRIKERQLNKKLKLFLSKCNPDNVKHFLDIIFAGRVISNELAQLRNNFDSIRTVDNALTLIKYDPNILGLFEFAIKMNSKYNFKFINEEYVEIPRNSGASDGMKKEESNKPKTAAEAVHEAALAYRVLFRNGVKLLSEPRILEDAIERIQISIMKKLIADYVARLNLQPLSDAALLANCVLSYATAMNPVGESAQQYGKVNAGLVRNEALGLAAFAEVAEALSYLYAAITILLAIRTQDPFSELAAQLGARATELMLYIPNTYDICGSGDAGECIRAIAAFAVNM